MAYFPFFIDIEGKHGLIVGGGKVALRKLQKLLPYGAKLGVVAPEVLEELEQAAQKNNICIIKRWFQPSDLTGMDFVIAASDNEKVNKEISRLCRKEGILVNVVDSKEECGFIFPALVKSGKLSIGISTAGASPEVAATVRSRIAAQIPADMEDILDYLDGLRPLAKAYIKDSSRRAGFLKDMARICMDTNAVFDESETIQRLEAYIESGAKPSAGVLLVGAGCGCYDLITLRGLRAVQHAQVLVYDDLIDKRLLDHTAESCELIYVGKRSGQHSMPQEQINALLVTKAREGRLVVRLKGGDPFVFGRGMEEMTALRKEGIFVEYIPGITSCIAVPALAGISVTQREISRSFHVITGHTKAGCGELAKDIDFGKLAQLEGTLVFLMGLGNLKQITEGLVGAGKEAATPAAVVHGSFDSSVDVVRGTLMDIAAKAAEAKMQSPAVIVVGVVADANIW